MAVDALVVHSSARVKNCTRAECGRPIELMTHRGTEFCSPQCEEREYWEEEFDVPTE